MESKVPFRNKEALFLLAAERNLSNNVFLKLGCKMWGLPSANSTKRIILDCVTCYNLLCARQLFIMHYDCTVLCHWWTGRLLLQIIAILRGKPKLEVSFIILNALLLFSGLYMSDYRLLNILREAIRCLKLRAIPCTTDNQ